VIPAAPIVRIAALCAAVPAAFLVLGPQHGIAALLVVVAAFMARELWALWQHIEACRMLGRPHGVQAVLFGLLAALTAVLPLLAWLVV